MAINFPDTSVNNPATGVAWASGDTFVAGSITYKWDGVKWIGLGVTPTDRLIEGSNSLEIQSNILNWSGGNTFKFDYNDTGLSQILKGFDTSHNTANRGSTFRVGLQDGSFGGIEFENREGSNAAYNSQATHIIRHDGGVVGDVKALSVMPWGDIGINQTSPTSQSGKVLHISGDTGGQARIHLSTSASGHSADEGHYIVSQGAESGANAGQLAFVSMENRNIVFNTGSVGANFTRFTIQHDGNLNIADGNLIVASGHGIDFSATSESAYTIGTPSEVLADYEEGTFSPDIQDTGSSATYTSQNLQYIKTGRMVMITGRVQCTRTGTGGGVLQFRLPFAADNSNSAASSPWMSHGNCFVHAIGIPGDGTGQFFWEINSTTHAGLFYQRNNQSWTSVPTAQIPTGSNGYLTFTMTYRAAA